jgi:hypothetical protein
MPSALQIACDELRILGLVLRSGNGQYRVNYRDGREATEYVTDDLADAVRNGRKMATVGAPKPEAPPGPIGPNDSRRSRMYRHNRKLAARRQKRGMGTDQ